MKMNIKYLFILAVVGFSKLNAQITITTTQMPKAKDTLRYSTVSPTGLSLGLNVKGASQSWDYSSLVSNGQDIYKYVAANSTPYAFYFLNQIGQKTADSIGAGPLVFKNLYSFYTNNSTVFKAEGLGYSYSGIPLAANYSDDDEIYQFPLNYGDSDRSTFKFKFAVPGVNLFTYLQAGTRTNVVDGWGSIKTPYQTYSSVLRVKTIVDEIDSLITTVAKIPIPRKQVIYKWLALTERVPVLEITGTETLGVFTATQIRFRDKYNGKLSPLRPRASFKVDKTSGFVNADTFSFTDQSVLGQGYTWQITPNTDIKYVNGTTAKTRNPKVVFGQRGLYTVSLVVTNQFGTDDTTGVDLITIAYGLGVNSTKENELYVYPTPAKGLLQHNFKTATQVTVLDATARVVTKMIAKPGIGLNISGLKSGVYYLQIADGKSIEFVVCE
jgi:PKD repeat protein